MDGGVTVFSCLSKMLHADRHRAKMDPKGGLKAPLMMNVAVPAAFEWACISLRSGDFHMARLRDDQTGANTGFVALGLEAEDAYHARLVQFLHARGLEMQWGGMAVAPALDGGTLDAVRAYFDAYDLAWSHTFVGLVGFAALAATGRIAPPAPVADVGDLRHEDLEAWMEAHGHVGLVGDVPVHYNAHLGPYVAFGADPLTVGLMTRVRDHVSVLVHNAERGLVIVKIDLASP